jgi:hypothetical protein
MAAPMRTTLLLLTLSGMNGAAQPARPTARSGDSTLATEIGRELRTIYDSARPGQALLGENLLGINGGFGTEVRGFVVDGRLSRVIAEVWTDAGKYAAEYFFTGDALLFVFETYSYKEGAPASTTSRNFWGVRSWERRSYFRRTGEIGYGETIGDGGPAPGVDSEQLRVQALRARALLVDQVKR